MESIINVWTDLPLASMVSNSLIKLPTPSAISYIWNLGSLLGMLVVLQILTGILLTFFYTNSGSFSFDSLWSMHLEAFNGNLIHLLHLNFASFIFIIMYFHFLKGLYYQSFKTNKSVYISGLILLILMMAIAFLGYVLPYGQMSLWGATVITNLISIISKKLVIWIWSGFSVNDMTLKFFFTLHFLLPMVLLMVIVMHLVTLHYSGSTNFSLKIWFWPSFVYKDMMNIIVILLFFWFTFKYSYFTSDPDNFTKANLAISPIHIKPEWYFLTFYAILRSIPNKMMGIIMFAMSLVSLFFLVFNSSNRFTIYYPLWGLNISIFVGINLLLFDVGSKPVEYPYLEMGQILTVLYFSWIGLNMVNWLDPFRSK